MVLILYDLFGKKEVTCPHHPMEGALALTDCEHVFAR